jgi:hypothetical protein
MINITEGRPSDGMKYQEIKHSQSKPLKIRSMACLMSPAKYQERPLKPSVIFDRYIHGHVIHANGLKGVC